MRRLTFKTLIPHVIIQNNKIKSADIDNVIIYYFFHRYQRYRNKNKVK